MRLVRLRCGHCGRQVGYLQRDNAGDLELTWHAPRSGPAGRPVPFAALVADTCPNCRRRLHLDPSVLDAAHRTIRDGRLRTVHLR